MVLGQTNGRAGKKKASGRARRRSLASPRDLERSLRIFLAASIAWLLPERAWPAVVTWVARWYTRLGLSGGEPQLPARTLRSLDLGRTQLAHALAAARLRETVLVMAHYRPMRWRPRVVLTGGERVSEVLAGGHGAVLWTVPFECSSLVAKAALHTAGLKVSHLSRPSHPFSDTSYGVYVLNPVQRRVEDRYLASRVSLGDDGGIAGLRAVVRKLRANEAVSITVGDAALEVAEVAFLKGTLRLATGPLQLARLTSASLLPVMTRALADGSFAVTVEGALPTAESDGVVLKAFAAVLEDHVRDAPMQWTAWHLYRETS